MTLLDYGPKYKNCDHTIQLLTRNNITVHGDIAHCDYCREKIGVMG